LRAGASSSRKGRGRVVRKRRQMRVRRMRVRRMRVRRMRVRQRRVRQRVMGSSRWVVRMAESRGKKREMRVFSSSRARGSGQLVRMQMGLVLHRVVLGSSAAAGQHRAAPQLTVRASSQSCLLLMSGRLLRIG
jgi:hypothetical protein